MHIYRHEIAWGDMDAFGHVNNATYFNYFEIARVNWLQTLVEIKGTNFGSNKVGPVIKTASIEYLRPIVFPAALDIHLNISNLRRSGFTLDYNIKQNDIEHAIGATVIVWVDFATGRPVELPKFITELVV